MAAFRPVSAPEVEDITHRLAQEILKWNEPIPNFETRYPGKLESCLLTPFQTFARRTLYKGLVGKAAILFYLLIKNHPFQNGNKRIAMTTVFYFFYRHGYWIRVDNQKLYNFAKWVASSDPEVRDATVAAINKFFKTYMIKLK